MRGLPQSSVFLVKPTLCYYSSFFIILSCLRYQPPKCTLVLLNFRLPPLSDSHSRHWPSPNLTPFLHLTSIMLSESHDHSSARTSITSISSQESASPFCSKHNLAALEDVVSPAVFSSSGCLPSHTSRWHEVRWVFHCDILNTGPPSSLTIRTITHYSSVLPSIFLVTPPPSLRIFSI